MVSAKSRFPVPPLISRPDEIIAVKTAIGVVDKSEKTIRRWAKNHGLGSNGQISVIGLVMVSGSDWQALELLREGKRHHPLVRRYFQQLGYIYVAPKRTKALEPEPQPEWRKVSSLTPAEIKHAVMVNPDLKYILDPTFLENA